MRWPDMPKGRLRILLPVLAIAAGLAIFGDKTPAGAAKVTAVASRPVSSPAVAPARPATVTTSTASTAAEPLESLRPREELVQAAPGGAFADLFASPRWSMPPPPPAPVAQVAAPVVIAPPAYRVIGKKEEDGVWELYLGREDSSFVVREGDLLDGTWRVGKIEPPMARLTHLQSGAAHDLPIGDSR